MSKHEFLRTSLTTKEKVWGWRYLLFQIIFLPTLLSTVNWFLDAPLSSSVLNFIFFSINFAAAILIFHRYLRQFLAIDWRRLVRILIAGILFFLLYWLCNLLLGMLLAVIDPTFSNQNDQTIADMTQDNFLLMAIGTVIFVPITEEVFHRGLIFRGLYDWSAPGAYLISAAVFSAVHLTSYVGTMEPFTLFLSFLQYIPAGLCLAGAYRMSGSLLCPVLIHAAVNAAGILALR